MHSYTKLDASALVDEVCGSHFGVLVWGVGDCWASCEAERRCGESKTEGKAKFERFHWVSNGGGVNAQGKYLISGVHSE